MDNLELENLQMSPAVLSGESPTVTENVSPHELIIEPAKSWEWINVSELWRSRELLWFFVWRDIKVRYKQTVLGAAWAILQPMMMVIVFSIFFNRLAGVSTAGIPAPLFYLTGLLPWFFFSTALSGASNSVLGSERLITKIYFPRLAIPFAAIGVATADFLVAMLALFAMMIYFNITPSWTIVLLPCIWAIIALLATGLGTFLAALNVRFRDFRYVIPFVIQVGMFATPTIYMQPTGQETGTLKLLLDFNPMTGLIAAFRNSILTGIVDAVSLAIASGIAILAFVFGCLYFRKTEDSFADII